MPLGERIDAYVRDYLDAQRLVGMAVAVVQDDAVVFSGGYGVQDRETRRPATAQTLFHIASVAKTMTGTAIFQLREQGKVDLDDPIVEHVPSFRVDDPRSDHITIRDCLCHVSGIGHPEDYGWDRPEFDDESLERHVRGLATHRLVDVPPSTTSYSDIAFNVLGQLIAEVSGTKYEQYMETHLFDPLGMVTTTQMAPRAAHPDLVATGYEQQPDGSIVQSLYPYNRMHVPCGCIASSAAEMARWCRVNLNRGELDGVRILAWQSYPDMWRSQFRAVDDEEQDPALGWWVSREYDELVVQHSGADDGFSSNLCLWTESGIGIVALFNSMWGGPWDVTDGLYRILVEAN
jgi:CubicO group peptidase (beta-lactamase class C family)